MGEKLLQGKSRNGRERKKRETRKRKEEGEKKKNFVDMNALGGGVGTGKVHGRDKWRWWGV